MRDDRQQCLKERYLQQIPSEYIEPYLVAMLSVELECIEFTPTEERLEEAKQNLKGVERFVSRFCGIHARYATNNVYSDFYRMTLNEAKLIIMKHNSEHYGEEKIEAQEKLVAEDKRIKDEERRKKWAS